MRAKQQIFLRANRSIPGGVNSPVRAWKAVGGVPLFIGRGKGSYIFDADGKRYVDFVGSCGPLLVGPADRQVLQAVQRRALQGFPFGGRTILEVDLAEAVAAAVPSVEKL